MDPLGRLWAIAEGGLWRLQGDWIERVDVKLDRPWALGATTEHLWIGGKERVWRLALT